MASIKEGKKNGTVVPFYFTASFGKDAEGKQIRRYYTWTPPIGMTLSKARKAAVLEAEKWEAWERGKIENGEMPPHAAVPIVRNDDFVAFVNDIWMPLEVKGSQRKPKTIAFYEAALKILIIG